LLEGQPVANREAPLCRPQRLAHAQSEGKCMTNPPLAGLQCRREKQGLTTYQLAPAIGVSQSHYAKIEAGKVRLDVHRAAMLAKRLGCRIEDLL
jgi:DNA-binding XRE family transcriptional regulator